MTHTKIGSRFVVIGRVARASKKARREVAVQRASARRIVIIRDGEFVGNRLSR
jgi:hypothetical protein